MNLNDIIQAISTVGFPIVACVFFLWQNKVQADRAAAQIDKMNEALQQNTLALQELTFYIKNEDKGVDE